MLLHVFSFFSNRHRTIGMKPNEVNVENEQTLLETAYNYDLELSERRKAKFRVGDFVRLSEHRAAFDKSYTPNWTTAVFKVRKVQYNTDPITYLLSAYFANDEDILGSVYAEEMQHVENPDEYLVEKILRRKNGMAYVKWLGLDSAYNSWITDSESED